MVHTRALIGGAFVASWTHIIAMRNSESKYRKSAMVGQYGDSDASVRPAHSAVTGKACFS